MKKMARLICGCLLISSLLIYNAAIPTHAQARETILIKAGQLVDVKSGRVLAGQAILIEGDRIKEVVEAPPVAPHAPAETRVIDLSNATVLPGLIDCHTHLTMDLGGIASSFMTSVPRQALVGARN